MTAKDFKTELDALGDVSEIDLAIHSPGGSVLEGWAIFNLLKNHPAQVRATIGGLAASMGTVIAMAADTVEMPENAFFMIHNPSGMSIGDADEMRDYADLLDKMGDGIANVYAAKSGQEVDYIKDLMKQESWFTGAEAQELGFVDLVTGSMEAAALTGVIDECRAELEKAGIGIPECAVISDQGAVEDEEEEEKPADELDAGGELETGEQEATGDDEESDSDQEAEPDAGGFVDRVKAALLGRGDADARAEMAKLRGDYKNVQGELVDARAEIDDMQNLLDAQKDELVELRAARRTVLDLVTEAGFAPEEAASLPIPDSDETGETPGANVRDRFNAITDKTERRAFYEKHKAELLHS